MGWQLFAASATGASHRHNDSPCQDAHAYARRGDGFVGVVCDGAGSAAHSDAGARSVCDALTARLAGDETDPGALDEAAARERIDTALAAARAALAATAEAHGHRLKDYACTVVGALVGTAGGWIFHIGDGVAVARTPEADVVSAPDNGEYANQTFFLTGGDWRERLRLTAVPAGCRAVLLMSDGAMSFVMAKGDRAVYAPFYDPVARFLARSDEAAGNAALHATLDDARTHEITGDDKTLLLALAGDPTG